MQKVLSDFLFSQPAGGLHFDNTPTPQFRRPTSFPTTHEALIHGSKHASTSFPFLFSGGGSTAAVAPGAATAATSGPFPSSRLVSGNPSMNTRNPAIANPNGNNQYPDPEEKGINPATEINRIETNIMIYNGVIAAAAIGIGITMCLFVRSVLSPAKGYHGGDSDGEMDSDDEDESDSEED
jgi:hypothetical protein